MLSGVKMGKRKWRIGGRSVFTEVGGEAEKGRELHKNRTLRREA